MATVGESQAHHLFVSDAAGNDPAPQLRHSAKKSGLAAKVSHAYFNMLGHLFSLRELAAADHVVVLEDDLLPAPDFVHYFTQAACLVDRDPTVYAVSAWNDNGHWGRAADEARVFRGR